MTDFSASADADTQPGKSESNAQRHTPAPWGFGNTARYERVILGNNGTGGYVCHVTVEQAGGGAVAQSMEAEREANAYLLRAAPDMFDTLCKIERAEAYGGDKEGLHDLIVDLKQAARAAIAKATAANSVGTAEAVGASDD
jgi:hypothetical protein